MIRPIEQADTARKLRRNKEQKLERALKVAQETIRRQNKEISKLKDKVKKC